MRRPRVRKGDVYPLPRGLGPGRYRHRLRLHLIALLAHVREHVEARRRLMRFDAEKPRWPTANGASGASEDGGVFCWDCHHEWSLPHL